MKEIKRYEAVLVDGVPAHRPSESGRWVNHEDHAEIVAALKEQLSSYSMTAGQADQRKSESDAVRVALGFSADADDVSPSDLLDKIAALQEQVRAVNSLVTEFWLTRHLIADYVTTPHITDALKKIRAEGVCILTGKIQQLIDEGAFDAKEIGVAAGVVYEGARIADKLRAGEQS